MSGSSDAAPTWKPIDPVELQVVGREELLCVLCREVARIADASGVRVRLTQQPGQPSSETEYGAVVEPTIALPIRIGSRVFGSIEVSVGTLPDSGTIADIDALVSVAGAGLGALAGIASARTEARRDPLTGLANRRAFDEDLPLRLTDPATATLSLALIDLDDLKAINGRDGHLGGDAALRSLARALIASTRQCDAAFRIGGDEFAVIIDAGAEGATDIVARLRAAAAPLRSGRAYTFSAGIATTAASTRDAAALIAAADAALLAAKRRGKNVTLHTLAQPALASA